MVTGLSSNWFPALSIQGLVVICVCLLNNGQLVSLKRAELKREAEPKFVSGHVFCHLLIIKPKD